ncbi:MAG: DNA-directed polymerase [Edaphobacter sp.]|nr:DNA-directed polymerase [Edaphobacter sp.]
MRKIVHIDMDAFYMSVEQRDDPRLRGKPVVVAWRGNRSVVCAASYEARRFGIRSAMPAVRAERLCPEAIFIPPDFPRYRAVSRSVREIFTQHTELIEPLSLDEAYLDVTEQVWPAHCNSCGTAIRAQIREQLSLAASAGVAPNKFLAKIRSPVVSSSSRESGRSSDGRQIGGRTEALRVSDSGLYATVGLPSYGRSLDRSSWNGLLRLASWDRPKNP